MSVREAKDGVIGFALDRIYADTLEKCRLRAGCYCLQRLAIEPVGGNADIRNVPGMCRGRLAFATHAPLLPAVRDGRVERVFAELPVTPGAVVRELGAGIDKQHARRVRKCGETDGKA